MPGVGPAGAAAYRGATTTLRVPAAPPALATTTSLSAFDPRPSLRTAFACLAESLIATVAPFLAVPFLRARIRPLSVSLAS